MADPKSDEAVKQLNVRLAEPIRRQLKAKCALDDVSMEAAVDELIREYVAGRIKLKPRTRPQAPARAGGGSQ